MFLSQVDAIDPHSRVTNNVFAQASTGINLLYVLPCMLQVNRDTNSGLAINCQPLVSRRRMPTMCLKNGRHQLADTPCCAESIHPPTSATAVTCAIANTLYTRRCPRTLHVIRYAFHTHRYHLLTLQPFHQHPCPPAPSHVPTSLTQPPSCALSHRHRLSEVATAPWRHRWPPPGLGRGNGKAESQQLGSLASRPQAPMHASHDALGSAASIS
mgnify:CR=1 FL=1